MSERPFEWKRDGGGLALFVVGTFVSVLMVKSLTSDQPLDELTGTAAFAAAIVQSFGAFPWLVLSAGVAFLGARSFVTASEAGALRHALGLIGCAVGLSILFGAFSDTAGGRFGLLTGGALALLTHSTLGGLVGLCVVLGAAWYAWLRAPNEHYEEQIRSSVTDRAQVADPGVTAAEAAGLIPEDLPQVQVLARKPSYAIPAAAPTSPYPEDVRLKGQVPAGARPIATPHATPPHAAAPRVAPVESFESDVELVQPFSAGPDLASVASAAAAAPAPAAREVRPLPAGVRPLAPADEELIERNEDRVPADEALVESAPERPSWERTGLGEDDEPVDAYGTPLSLVESLRKAQEEMVAIPESPAAELEAEPVAELVEEEEEELEQPLLAEALDSSEDELLDEDLDDEDELDEEEDEDADEDEDEDEEETDEEEVELFADEEEDSLAEEAPVAAVAPQELEQAVMAESEEFAAEEEEDFVEIVEELVPASELEETVAELEPEAEVEPELEAEPVAEAVAEAAVDTKALAQTTIFDFTGESQPSVELFPEGLPEPAAEIEAPVEAPATEIFHEAAAEATVVAAGDIELDIGEEPEVVLQPQAAPADRSTHKSLSQDPKRAQLLKEAGYLFVERGRVAVSMLQRQYGMDFDDACKVLDELQDLGLIGPYLGGQRRDILLTRDQWMEKAGAV